MIDRDIIDRIKNAQKVTFPGGRGGSKAPGKSQGTPSASTKPSQNKTTNQSQSKTAIKQMQTSMIAFRTAFNQLAIGSNEVGRRSTGENLDNDTPNILKKKIDDKKTEMAGLQDSTYNSAKKQLIQQEIDDLQKRLNASSNESKDVHGLRPIGQILLNDYIGKDTLQGMTFADVDMKQPGRMGQGTGAQDNVSFVGVIDSIGRVGTPADRQKTKQELDLEKQIKQLDDRIGKESTTPQAINAAKANIIKKEKEYYKSKGITVSPSDISYQRAQEEAENVVHKKYEKQYNKLREDLSRAYRLAEDTKSNKPGEEKEDGIWDVRTNNSLKNIAGITQGVLGFSKDMEINVPGYTQSNLESFKRGIPDDPELLRSKELQPGYESSITKLCNALTAHIKAQARYIELLRKNLFENPEYQSFMKQEKSLFDFNKTDQESMNKKHSEQRKAQESKDGNLTYENDNLKSMDQDSQEHYKRFYNHFDSNHHGAGIQVAINNKQWIVKYTDLSSVTGFENLYKRIYGGNEPTKEQILEFYNQINNSIQQFNQSKDYLAPVDEPLTQSVPYRVKVPSKLPWDRTETRYKTVPKN